LSRDPGLRSRLLIGAIAGVAGTLAMTMLARRLHRRLPRGERYPPPPREIIDLAAHQARLPLPDDTAKDLTTASHFAYGAACGSMLGAAGVRAGPITGAMAGAGIWAASYLGWIPGMGILKPATLHPKRRNALMIAAHLVWGAVTALTMRELAAARADIIAAGDDEDAA
jgi:hypothetical protein